MTLPRKNSRIITIDTVRYRWTVSPQPGFDGGPGLLTFLAHEERKRRLPVPKLHVSFDERHCDVVTPTIASALIRGGLKRGWDPRGAKDHNIGPLAAIKLLCV
jgi:hypothetical protein